MIITSRIKNRNKQRGAALVEFALGFPVALAIVLGTIHIGDVLRDANVVIEASRHGARSAAALSGLNSAPAPAATWVNNEVSDSANCNQANVISEVYNSAIFQNIGNFTAIVAACSYIQASNLNRADWRVTSTIDVLPGLDAVLTYAHSVKVLVEPLNARGPVNSLKLLLNMRPQGYSCYPLEVL